MNLSDAGTSRGEIEAVGRWVIRVLREHVADPCTDNFRVAELGDWDDMQEYFSKRGKGCCATFDKIAGCPVNGKTYLVGCNYGHFQHVEPEEE